MRYFVVQISGEIVRKMFDNQSTLDEKLNLKVQKVEVYQILIDWECFADFKSLVIYSIHN